jgi:flagellar motor switch protein FliG
MIQNEHPQTIALILSYCTVEQSSAILSELREIYRWMLSSVSRQWTASPEIVKDIERLIERKMQMSETGEFTEIGGTKYIAEVLNSVDRGTEKYIMDELSKKDPKLSEEIRNSMFVFEDIANLEPIYIQRFLQDVNTNDLLIALKGASKEVVDIFYQNMSMRMRKPWRRIQVSARRKAIGCRRKTAKAGRAGQVA